MKSWTRTSLILLAFSIGACESQSPTAPTSSLTPSGALATGAQGQVTSLTAVGAGDIQQAKGGKPCEEGDTRPKCNDEGNDNNKVAYSVKATKGDCNDPLWNAWIGADGVTGEKGLFVRWGDDDLTVTTVPLPGSGFALVLLHNNAIANVIDKKGQIVGVDLYIRDDNRTRYRTDRLPIFSTVTVDSVNGFTIHVNAPNATVFKLKTGSGGPVVGTVGTICVGDLDFTPIP